MTPTQWLGALSLLPLLLPLLALRWPGHAAAPMLATWAIAHALFCAPLAVLLASGWIVPEHPQVASGCLIYALAALAIGIGIGAVEVGAARLGRPGFGLARLCDALDAVPTRTALLAALALHAIRSYAFAAFGILFSGSRVYSAIDGAMPGWFAVLIALADVAGYALFAWGVQRLLRPEASPWERGLGAVLAVIEFAYALLSGRRWAMMLGVLGLLIWWHLRRPSPLRLTIAGLLAVGATPLLFLLFVSLRLGNWEAKLSADPQAAVDVDRMLVITRERLADGSALAELERNLRDRPYNLFAFAGEVHALSERPMLGAAIASSLFWALPGNLVDKRGVPMSEELIQAHLGQPPLDTASSWAAYAIADLGLAGAIVYGLIIACLFLAALHALPGAGTGAGHALVAAGVFFCLFQIEQDPATSFAMLRNLSVALVAVAGLRWLTARWRAAVRPGPA